MIEGLGKILKEIEATQYAALVSSIPAAHKAFRDHVAQYSRGLRDDNSMDRTLFYHWMSHKLGDRIPVAMLGYVGGDYLGDTAYTRPAGVGRVVNVTGNGFLLTGRNLFWNGTAITGAANVRLPASHFWLPTHPKTVAMLLAGLSEVSAGH